MSSQTPVMHPVYRLVNRPLRIWGVERRLFLLAVGLGGAVFNLLHTLLGGVLIFGMLYGVGAWAAARDPDLLRILLASRGTRRRFDAVRFAGDRRVVTFRPVTRPDVVGD